MPAQLLYLPAGAALYDPDAVSPSELADLLEHGLTARSSPLEGVAGRQGVRIIRRADRSWVWRHNHRGGWPGRVVRDTYVWLGAERTRSFREWRLLHRARELGLPVPAPIAAVYERQGLTYQSDLITEWLPHTESLGRRLEAAPVPRPLWRRVGACIRQFHAHGIDHADLNVHNILLDADGGVFLIDFDRGVIRAPGSWPERNWSRLRRSLEKCSLGLPPGRFGPEEWAALREP